MPSAVVGLEAGLPVIPGPGDPGYTPGPGDPGHEALGDPAKAVAARTEELALLRGTHNDRHLAVAHAHLASLQHRRGRTEEAALAASAARAAAADGRS